MLDIDLFLESTPRTRVARSPTVVLKKDDILLDTPPKPKVNKSKRKGNSYENKIAKQLGRWIFNDEVMLNRSITSGAVKTNYLGDIVPQKPLPWKDSEFPFLIECKNGYANQASDFNNTTLLDTWLLKLLKERTEDQPIIWLIVSFHAHQPLFITDLELTIKSNIILKEVYNGRFELFYIYKLKELFEYDFYYLYNNNLELMKIFNKII